MTNPVAELTNKAWDAMPDLNTLPGFFVYSFLIYLIVVFLGWLLNPTVDRIIEQEEQAARERDKGRKMRQETLERAKKFE